MAADPSFPRSDAAARAGLHASLCAPIVSDHKFRGAIEFFSVETGEPDHATREILATTATQMGRFIGLLDERSRLVAKLERLALTDELTDLPNRRAWQQSLERELALARRHGQPLCVAMLDLDHFKRYNDTHGHQEGDRLLGEISQTWRPQLRTGDILERYGGERVLTAAVQLADRDGRDGPRADTRLHAAGTDLLGRSRRLRRRRDRG